jgi:hypothetical protein
VAINITYRQVFHVDGHIECRGCFDHRFDCLKQENANGVIMACVLREEFEIGVFQVNAVVCNETHALKRTFKWLPIHFSLNFSYGRHLDLVQGKKSYLTTTFVFCFIRRRRFMCR